MSDATAFELASAFARGEVVSGATAADPRDGSTVDIHALLEAGDGQIVTDDPVLAEVLRDRIDLTETKVREQKPAATSQSKPAAAAQQKG